MKQTAKILGVSLVVLAALALSTTPARADHMGVTEGQVDWFGAVFTIHYLGDDGSGNYDFLYRADFTNFDSSSAGAHTGYIIGINYKPSEGDLTAGSLTSNPGGTWTDAIDTNLSANGCSGGGNNFFCSEQTGGPLLSTTTGATYEWEFTLSIDGNPDVNKFLIDAPFRALFTDGDGKYALMSETTSLPEPASILLLGLGLAGVAGLEFRKKCRS